VRVCGMRWCRDVLAAAMSGSAVKQPLPGIGDP
jgi:hypothetical protein